MANDPAASAANRFGLGARPGELQRIGRDPRGWLLAQLQASPQPAAFAGLPGSTEYLAEFADYRQQRRERKAAMAAGGNVAKGGGARRGLQREVLREVVLRQGVAVASDAGFRERLVRFWSNHFAISVDKFQAALFAAPMEREAIRPHVNGRFLDMLLAVERHPGMLIYLDNVRSIGTDSRLATMASRRAAANPKARKPGLNENLAREIMELHTLGVDGGYTQADVVEFAKAITGWSLVRGGRDGGHPDNAFAFHAVAHEPGTRRVMGKAYAEDGEAQGMAILRDLALHPATARHLSFKLARHFVADAPPPVLVERMATAYLRNGGELPALYRAMVGDDAAWAPGARKFKSPDDCMVSALRACSLDDPADYALSLRLQGELGQPVFQPRSPAGFGDTAADWGGPDALFKRVQAAQSLAERLPSMAQATPLGIAQAALGASLDAETATVLRRAESVQQGVALLLASPAFQWRT